MQLTEGIARLEFKLPTVPLLEVHNSRDTGNTSISMNEGQWPCQTPLAAGLAQLLTATVFSHSQ